MKITYRTLGCKVNQYETENIRFELEKQGYETVFDNSFDICIINTCTVTSIADGKSRAVIRRAIKDNPKAFVIVTGCYSDIKPDDIKTIDGVDLIIPNEDKDMIVERIKTLFPTKTTQQIIRPRTRTRAVLKVQDGCSQFCAYCIIPYARNKFFSADPQKMIDEVNILESAGHKEIVLTGIRLGSYNFNGHKLPYLIESLLNNTKIDRIRLSSIEMWETGDELLDLMSDSRMAKHLHIPLQSGSDKILKLMNRPYSTTDYLNLIEKINNKIPNIAVTTDVITGFPYETDDDFSDSLNTIETAHFSRLHIFRYSKRQGTPAADMPSQIDPKIKKQRLEALTDTDKKLRLAFAAKFVGTKADVIFETQKKDGLLHGYTSNYTEVTMDSKLAVKNQLTEVKIIGINKSDLTLTACTI